MEGAEILNRTGLPFIVQTTAGSHNLGELEATADFAHERLAAKVWNLHFLVPTGRGQFVSDITFARYDAFLPRSTDPEGVPSPQDAREHAKNAGAETDPISTDARLRPGDGGKAETAGASSLPGLSSIRTYSGRAGGCPAGTHYMGIRPNGDVTPCPYTAA